MYSIPFLLPFYRRVLCPIRSVYFDLADTHCCKQLCQLLQKQVSTTFCTYLLSTFFSVGISGKTLDKRTTLYRTYGLSYFFFRGDPRVLSAYCRKGEKYYFCEELTTIFNTANGSTNFAQLLGLRHNLFAPVFRSRSSKEPQHLVRAGTVRCGSGSDLGFKHG
jgi:hypothetical protein